jgi:anti-anti-sigma factor
MDPVFSPLFAVEVLQRGDTRRLALQGELDMTGVSQLLTVLQTEERQKPPLIRIDLSKLTFMDVTGARVLRDATNRARHDGRRVIVVNPQPPIRRLFDLISAHRVLEVEFD